MQMSNTMRTPHSNKEYSFDEITRQLTVTDLMLSDTGEYICTAQSADKQTSRSHKFISVLGKYAVGNQSNMIENTFSLKNSRSDLNHQIIYKKKLLCCLL